MVAQGVLGFQYESDASSTGLTSLAGLPLYLDLIHACGVDVAVAGAQGWLDLQMVLAVIFLNLAGATASRTSSAWKPTPAWWRFSARSSGICCRAPSGGC